MDQINAFLDVYGLAALFALLLLKSLGVPIPIPNDLILMSMAIRAAEGRLIAWQAFFAGLIALVIGGTIQFIAIRAVGRGPLYRYGRHVGLTPNRLDAAADKVRKSSPVGIGLAIFTPGLRSMVVTACGLAGLRLRTFAAGQIVGSTLLLGNRSAASDPRRGCRRRNDGMGYPSLEAPSVCNVVVELAPL